MDYWKEQQRLQKMLSSWEPLQAELRMIEEATKYVDIKQNMMSTMDLATQMQAVQAAVPDLQHMIEMSRIVEDSIRSFPDLQKMLSIKEWRDLDFAYSSINQSIQNSLYLGEVELPEYESEEEREENFVKDVESSSIEIVPAETLSTLQSVGFEPFSILDKVLRNPDAMHAFGWRKFEEFIAILVGALGFTDVVLTSKSGDKGRDVLATKVVAGMPILFAFECKKWAPSRKVGPAVARALLGVIDHADTRANKGVLVTTSSFSPSAERFILTEPSLDGADFNGVVEWLGQYDKSRNSAT